MISTGGEGKVQAKKRVRGKIGNPRNYPEIKMHNLFVNGTDTTATYYTNKVIKGVYNNSDYDKIWFPLTTYWPTEGTNQFQRIGRKIRVKFLRIKGFVFYSPFLITQVRLRLVLYRSKTITNPLNATFLYSLYNFAGNMQNAVDLDDLQGKCVTNFYCSYFNNDKLKELDCKRRVVYRGLIKPQPDAENYYIGTTTIPSVIDTGEDVNLMSHTVGKVYGPLTLNNATPNGNFNGAVDTPGVTLDNLKYDTDFAFDNLQMSTVVPPRAINGEFQHHYLIGGSPERNALTPGNQRGFFPIDVTIDMNDAIDVLEYMYFFVLESDWAVGQTTDGTFGYSNMYANYGMNIIPQIFYTDD